MEIRRVVALGWVRKIEIDWEWRVIRTVRKVYWRSSRTESMVGIYPRFHISKVHTLIPHTVFNRNTPPTRILVMTFFPRLIDEDHRDQNERQDKQSSIQPSQTSCHCFRIQEICWATQNWYTKSQGGEIAVLGSSTKTKDKGLAPFSLRHHWRLLIQSNLSIVDSTSFVDQSLPPRGL